jgi:hypothetical protein
MEGSILMTEEFASLSTLPSDVLLRLLCFGTAPKHVTLALLTCCNAALAAASGVLWRELYEQRYGSDAQDGGERRWREEYSARWLAARRSLDQVPRCTVKEDNVCGGMAPSRSTAPIPLTQSSTTSVVDSKLIEEAAGVVSDSLRRSVVSICDVTEWIAANRSEPLQQLVAIYALHTASLDEQGATPALVDQLRPAASMG